MHTQATIPPSTWPFPAAGHFRKAAAPPPAADDDNEAPDDRVDHAENELVEEQKERDRKAAQAVDPNRKDNKPTP